MAKPKTTQSLAHDLAQRIRLRIQSERLADGSLFMTEAQLAAEYGASRTVAREAMGRLRALGIVEGRQGKGLVIRRPDVLQLLSESLPSLAGSPDERRELAQFRYVLEVGAIDLAVRHASDEQIDELRVALEDLERSFRGRESLARRKATDLRFHVLILQMTGSPLIAGMQQVLADFFALIKNVKMDVQAIERMIWEHRELYLAIRNRDIESARVLMRLQLRNSAELPSDLFSAPTTDRSGDSLAS